jgi:2-polyprenyl-3-methyl-5-hydroxy-6-metoxy-1,4-benzoquinol methylase
MKQILGFTALSILTAMICAYYWRIHSMPYYLSIVGKSSTETIAQVFYNSGDGYNAAESATTPLSPSNTFEELVFPLPTEIIRNLRFDPLLSAGSFEIQRATIRGRKKIRGEYEILHEFDLNSFNPINEVNLSRSQLGNLIAHAPEGSLDPIIEISLNSPLDHWEFQDFLDREWLNKTAFLSLLITPLIIALSLPSKKKSNELETISFKIGSENFILNSGESHSVEPIKCYRDTDKEKIFDILNLMNTGTKGEDAVEETFAETNPWLCSIITSPKRYKFLEEMSLEQNQRVLDIGAGWGQTAIPLARANKVCALEPTPERMDFIQAAAKQEHVEENLFFIGSDYMEAEFQTKFDLILSIGVLEWVAAFREDGEPEEIQAAFLAKTKTDLRIDGKLVIGIENRLGLKYLLGANDDHIGVPNIACLTKDLAKKQYKHATDKELRCLTHSMAEYEKMLKEAGYCKVQFYAALPDYKLPERIFPIQGNQCEMNEFLLNGGWFNEHDGTNGNLLPNQAELKSLYLSLAEMNLAHYFAPSFFIEAS